MNAIGAGLPSTVTLTAPLTQVNDAVTLADRTGEEATASLARKQPQRRTRSEAA